MKILDCETINSIYTSLEVITGVSAKEIKVFLTNLEIKNSNVDKSNFILEEFKIQYNPPLEYDLVYWFHLTRTFDPNEFKDGILPLGEAIDKIWDSLFTLVDGKITLDEWLNYRNNLENGNLGIDIESNQGFQYRTKIIDKFHWGPYGFLIKDHVLRDTHTSNHYFNHPEIILHICYPFKRLHGYDLLDMYKKNSNPGIVKFQSHLTDSEYLGDALFYLYNLIHEKEITPHSNNTIDNHGKKVPAEDIISIELK